MSAGYASPSRASTSSSATRSPSRKKVDPRHCKIVEAHYFRGRFSAEDAERHGALLRERKFEDVLVKAGVTPHFLLMSTTENEAGDGVVTRAREKGIDIWLALEAYELSLQKSLDVVVLVSGDGDFVHLVRKLGALGTRIMVTAWGFEIAPGGPGTRTAQVLLEAVTYPVMMDAIVDDPERRDDPLIENLFVPRLPDEAQADPKTTDARGKATDGRRKATDGRRKATDGRGKATDGRGKATTRARTRRSNAAVDEVPQQVDGAEAAGDGDSPGGPSESSDWSTGIVANLPMGKDFGFIQPGAGGENLFFYRDWVEACEFRDLKVGDSVRFLFSTNPRDGRPNARRVRRGLVT